MVLNKKKHASMLVQPLDCLISWVESREYEGYDIYDGLSLFNSQLVLNNRALNPLITQFFKRLPLNLRPIFGIETVVMPKAIGLFLHSYILFLSSYQQKEKAEKIKNTIESLKECFPSSFLSKSSSRVCPPLALAILPFTGAAPVFAPSVPFSAVFSKSSLSVTARPTKCITGKVRFRVLL